ncbi:MAG: hypothetical protein INR64_00850 [Caulobacteraceae bacterium]|nr:hypothetical protein [Caulobacter sp.]
MDPKLRRTVIWLAAAGSLFVLFALQLMDVIPRPWGFVAGLLVIVAGWLSLKRGDRA